MYLEVFPYTLQHFQMRITLVNSGVLLENNITHRVEFIQMEPPSSTVMEYEYISDKLTSFDKLPFLLKFHKLCYHKL